MATLPFLAALGSAPALADRYKVIDLDLDPAAEARINAISDLGIPVGEVYDTGTTTPHAVVWAVNIGTQSASNQRLNPTTGESSALAVYGYTVAGWVKNTDNLRRAVFWSSQDGSTYSGPVYLPLPANFATATSESWATGINPSTVVGVVTDGENFSPPKEFPVYWQFKSPPNSPPDTPMQWVVNAFERPADEYGGQALAIDARSPYAAGYVKDGNGNLTAMLWHTDPKPAEGAKRFDDLPSKRLTAPQNYGARVTSLNSARAVGWYDPDAGVDDDERALIWERARWEFVYNTTGENSDLTYIELDALGGDFSHAFDDNSAGQTVGSAGSATAPHASLYTRTCGQQDMNDLLHPDAVPTGWTLTAARAITDNNANNLIVGSALLNGVSHEVLLTPGTVDTDLAVTLSVNQERIEAGQDLVYVITVTNNAASDYATCVHVDDVLPPGMTPLAVEASAGVCTVEPASVSCLVKRLDAGSQLTITLTVQARPILAGRIANNTVSVVSNENDTNAANDRAQVEAQVDRSGCFIATAAYGSYLDPHVQTLRDFRDHQLLSNVPGRWFVDFYYRHAPPVAMYLEDHPGSRLAMRLVLTPLVLAVVYPHLLLLAAAAAGLVLVALTRLRRRRGGDKLPDLPN